MIGGSDKTVLHRDVELLNKQTFPNYVKSHVSVYMQHLYRTAECDSYYI